MLYLNGQVLQVSPKQEKDFKTGEISNIHVVQIQHTYGTSANSPFEIETIKLKEPAQVEAFVKAKGQQITVPVQVWTTEKGNQGFWLEKGILPTVQKVA